MSEEPENHLKDAEGRGAEHILWYRADTSDILLYSTLQLKSTTLQSTTLFLCKRATWKGYVPKMIFRETLLFLFQHLINSLPQDSTETDRLLVFRTGTDFNVDITSRYTRQEK